MIKKRVAIRKNLKNMGKCNIFLLLQTFFKERLNYIITIIS